ncbi:hypothetical protein D3Z60_20015 [Lachnospiraceae bacterium]|jgi:hypothetical protein|nr:hypothetical protein [Lachnospiraceae bacterium]
MAKITSKIDAITGKSDQERILKEQFALLQKMTQAKCDQFEAELKSMFTSGGTAECEIVGKRAIAYRNGQHVDIKVGCDDAIKDAIDMFFNGKDDVKQGFQKLIRVALDALIGNTSMGEHEEKMFFIYPENFAIVRVDVKCYKYCFSSSGIIANTENVFCYTMAKSIVDHTKVTIDELLYMVTEMIGADKLEEVKAFVKELKEVWNILEDKNPTNVLQVALQHNDIK